MPHAVSLDEVAREKRAEAPGPAGHEHGAVVPAEPSRNREDDLADDASLRQRVERLPRTPDVEGRDRRERERPSLEQREDLSQHLAETIQVDVEEIECAVRDAGMLTGDDASV